MNQLFEIEDATRPSRLDIFKGFVAASFPLVVTIILIAVNVGVYAVMVVKGRVSPIAPTADALLHWGANYAPLATHGEMWRVLTSVFVHVGIVHLLMNMAVLWSAGRIMEPMFGPFDFLLLYLLTGVAGSLTSMAVHPLTVSAGASGAIFGLFGGLTGAVAARPASMSIEQRMRLLKYAFTFTLINFVYGFSQKNIDLAAHFGGFIAGVPIGIALVARTGLMGGAPVSRKAVLTVVVVAIEAAVAMRLPVTDDWLGELTQVAELDASSVAAYNAAVNKLRTSGLSVEEFDRTVEKLLVPWEKERAKVVSLHLPTADRARAEKLGTFMSLRAEAWRLNVAGVRNNDAAAIRNSSLKEESALVALKEFAPDSDMSARFEKLRAERAARDAKQAQFEAAQAQRKAEADAFVGEIKRVNVTEKDIVTTINQSLAKLRSKEMSSTEVADVIERQILPRWSRQRAELGRAHAPDGQTEFQTNLLRYMTLRDEGWSDMALALRTNDTGLAQESQRLEKEALRLSGAMTHVDGRSTSPSQRAAPAQAH